MVWANGAADPNIGQSRCLSFQLRARPIAKAQAAVDKARADLQHVTEIQQALETEIERAQMCLRLRRDSVHEALADVVCGSPEFAGLLCELDKAWARLRGLRKCFWVIHKALALDMPGPLMSAGKKSSRSTTTFPGHSMSSHRASGRKRWSGC